MSTRQSRGIQKQGMREERGWLGRGERERRRERKENSFILFLMFNLYSKSEHL